MPFSLGFWAAAGAGGGAAGAFEQISTTILTGNQASVSFSSIPSTYKHLQLRITLRSNTTGGSPLTLYGSINGSGAGYANHNLSGINSAVSSQSSFNDGGFVMRNLVPSNSGNAANIYNAIVMDFVDYSSTSKNKTVRWLGGYSGATPAISLGSILWANTAAISSISIDDPAGAAMAGSRFTLYGIKG